MSLIQLMMIRSSSVKYNHAIWPVPRILCGPMPTCGGVWGRLTSKHSTDMTGKDDAADVAGLGILKQGRRNEIFEEYVADLMLED